MDLSKNKQNTKSVQQLASSAKFNPNIAEVKGEYIEEEFDTVKKESVDNQTNCQFMINRYSSPLSQPFPFLTIPHTTSAFQPSSLSHVSPFYPHSRIFPPYPTLLSTAPCSGHSPPSASSPSSSSPCSINSSYKEKNMYQQLKANQEVQKHK